MNLLSVETLSKSFADKPLFENLTFGISQGEKIALVGVNGAGKSTLMKIISGMVEPDQGAIALRKGARMGYLPQEPKLEADKSVLENVLLAFPEIASVLDAYERIMQDPNADADAMQAITEQMGEIDGWTFESQIKEFLARFGISDHTQLAGTLSGGQIKRVAFVKLLLEKPDILLLDEPTNHLDIETIEWLEAHLNTSDATLLMVTHDRYFLGNITNVIFEIADRQLYRYQGSYADFLEKKEEREQQKASTLAKAKNLYRKELEWIRKQPKARGTKAKYRVDAFDSLKQTVTAKNDKLEMEIGLGTSRLGSKIFELKNVQKSFGSKCLVDNFSYTFKRGDRIGIVGPNGVGKTTFVNILTGALAPDAGEIEQGQTIKVGYYTQHSGSLNLQNRVIEEIKEIAEYITLADGSQVSVAKLLEMFLFPGALQYTPIEKLSGGERRRLLLLKVLVTQPNFLVLDEPTNDLDLDTLSVLEDYLETFPGCLLMVTHDRYFMDRLTDHLFVFKGNGQIQDYNGNYSDWREEQKELKPEEKKTGNAPAPSTESVKNSSPSSKRKLSYKEQKELSDLEVQIAQLESLKNGLIESLERGGNLDEITRISAEIANVDQEIESKTFRWLELSE